MVAASPGDRTLLRLGLRLLGVRYPDLPAVYGLGHEHAQSQGEVGEMLGVLVLAHVKCPEEERRAEAIDVPYWPLEESQS